MPRNLRRRRWPSVLVVLLLLVGGGAAAVHFKVMPLTVALKWFKPATLSVTSDPAGATLRLDGRELAEKTPLEVEVRRDRVEHTLELSRVGSKPVRTTMRFDRTVALSQSITLPEEPAPPPPPPPPPVVEPEPEPAPPVAAQPVDPEVVRKAARLEALAEEKAAKKAAKAAAKEGAREGKKKSKKAKASNKAKAAKGGSKAKAAKSEGRPSAEPGGAEF